MSNGEVFYPAEGRKSPWATVIVVISVIAALLPLSVYTYYGTVRNKLSFTISAEGLDAKFGVGSIHIPADEIAAVTYVDSRPSMTRSMGSGLRGLQMGWFRLDDYGRVYRLTTVGSPLVYVDTAEGAEQARAGTRYVFSPEDAEGFAAELRSIMAGAGSAAVDGAGTTFPPAASKTVFGDPIMIFSVIFTLALGIIMPIVVRRGRLGMRYAVGPDGIRVHHFGAKNYRWNSVRDVRRLDEPLPRMVRLMGTAMPGYFAGSFRAAGLGAVQVYATKLKAPVVLIETGVSKVLISPEDADGFLAAADGFRKNNGADGNTKGKSAKPVGDRV